MPEKSKVTTGRPITEVFNGSSTAWPNSVEYSQEDVAYNNHDLSELGTGDVGGPFILHRSSCKASYTTPRGGPFVGSQVLLHPYDPAPIADEPLRSTMWGLGGTAISRSLPTQPAFDGASFLAELYAGGRSQAIPKAIGSHIWREQALTARNAGHEFLNVEFGWAPLVSDIRTVCHAVVSANKIYQGLAKGSGHKTRTGYSFPATSNSFTSHGGAFLYSGNSGISGFDSGGEILFTEESGSVSWFSGCFRYAIPIDPGRAIQDVSFADKANHVLGLRLTPEALWNAAPWSWAVDWAINTGDIARNIGAFSQDSLYLQYGYIMTHAYKRRTYIFTGGDICGSCTTVYLDEWKKRFPASPYGFGLTYDGLSTLQKAVLAAAGITHF